MRLRHIALLTTLALAALPAGALAAKPTHPVTPASTNSNAGSNHGSTVKVLFLLHGKVTGYTGGTSIGLTLTGSNRDRSTLTSGSAFNGTLNSGTKVVLHDGAAVATGDKVVVKIRAPKNASAGTLSSTAAFQVVDQGH